MAHKTKLAAMDATKVEPCKDMFRKIDVCP